MGGPEPPSPPPPESATATILLTRPGIEPTTSRSPWRQLSDIPPIHLTESLSSIDSVTECTNDPFTHTPHPINQTLTGSPTNSTSLIRPFRIVTINVFQSCRNKTQELEHLITSVKPDVIIGTETWLNSTINSNEIIKSALGFNVYRKDRPNKSYGGVLIAVTND